MKANFGILPQLENTLRLGKRERGKAYAERSNQELDLILNTREL
jgi:folate-dependent tRNA-U54 methylase TrmFO/GidA